MSFRKGFRSTSSGSNGYRSTSASSYEYAPDGSDDDLDNHEDEDIRGMKRTKSDTVKMDDGKKICTVTPLDHSSGVRSGIKMMKADEIRREMQQRLDDITEALACSSDAAMKLLQKFKWSKEDLLEAYMNDSDRVLRQAGVYHRCGDSVPVASDDSICKICFDDVSMNSVPMMSMPCGHAFCQNCWYQFCVSAMSEGPGVVLRKPCPQPKCPEVLTEHEFSAVLGADNELFHKYQNFQLRSFVDSKALMRWCPGPGCDRVAYAMTASAMEAAGNVAHCDACFTSFCLNCGNEPHAPATCQNLAMWLTKCSNESETANWIIANTKECPKCQVRIEKNQGCNHMTCKHCRYEFCWLCMADWTRHGYNYDCNRFDNRLPAETDVEKARELLNRYLHYYQRYHAHSDGEKYAQKHLLEAGQKMDALKECLDNARWMDMRLLTQANEQLVKCRRILKFTYVFGYYLDSPEQVSRRNVFENYQERLERFTEQLSELSEKPLDQMDQNRIKLVEQTSALDRFVKNILDYVENGMEE